MSGENVLDREPFEEIGHRFPKGSGDDKSSLNGFAILYARAHLDCRWSEVGAACEALFAKKGFEEAKSVGESIITVIRGTAVEDVPRFSRGFQKAIGVLWESERMMVRPIRGNLHDNA